MKFLVGLLRFLLDLGRKMLETAILTAVSIFVARFMEGRAYGQA